jgi:hypothetical protein
MVPLDIEPFKELSDRDASLFIDAIKDINTHNTKYREEALKEKDRF